MFSVLVGPAGGAHWDARTVGNRGNRSGEWTKPRKTAEKKMRGIRAPHGSVMESKAAQAFVSK